MASQQQGWMTGIVTDKEIKPAWPAFPKVHVTLITSMSVLGIFLGLGNLTKQFWMIWVGLTVAGGILGFHLIRHRQIAARRKLTRQLLDARLISHCRRLESSDFMNPYYEGTSWVVLVLTEDALHICPEDDPLTIFTTVPLFQVCKVQLGPRESSRNGGAPGASNKERSVHNTVSLLIEVNDEKFSRLSFSDFRDTSASDWIAALDHSSSHFRKEPAAMN